MKNNAADAFNSIFRNDLKVFKIIIEFEDGTHILCPFAASILGEALTKAQDWAEQQGNKKWSAIFEAGKPESGISPGGAK